MSEFSFVQVDKESVQETETVMPMSVEETESSLSISGEALHSVISTARAQSGTQAGARIKAAPSVEERPSVDVVLVLDRSGSMAGSKLTLCKKTVSLLISELKPSDRFGLVLFDHQVNVKFPVESIGSNKEAMLKEVDRILTGGQTNLSGGLLKGIECLAEAGTIVKGSEDETKDRVRAVFLLTDGAANVGITDKNVLRHTINDAVARMPGAPPSIYTFGYGSEPNAELLQMVIPEERGGYYFVETTDKVLGAFADALGGLLSVVAQNVHLDILAEDATITKVRREGAKRLSKTHYTVDLGDIYAEEERDILVELENNGTKDLKLTFTLKYVDAIAGRLVDAEPVLVTIKATNDQTLLKQNCVSAHLTAQIARLDVADTLAEARAKADQGDFASAQSALGMVKATIETASAESHTQRDADLLRRLDSDVDMVSKACGDRSGYMRHGRHHMTSKMMTHQAQRCYSDSDSDGEDDVQQMETKSRNMYRNAGKKAMKAKWSLM